MCLFLNCGTKAQCLFAYNLSEKGVALWLQISFSALFIHSFIHSYEHQCAGHSVKYYIQLVPDLMIIPLKIF